LKGIGFTPSPFIFLLYSDRNVHLLIEMFIDFTKERGHEVEEKSKSASIRVRSSNERKGMSWCYRNKKFLENRLI